MSNSSIQPPTRPWTVDVIPDMFGYMVLIYGNSVYIPKEHFDAVIVALAMAKERDADGHDWLPELAEAIRGKRGEHSESSAERG
jgi:hypothetical protein